ncbi:MAG TPA: lipoyl(octanoyl) transferase LipB [Bacteroidales bacterium]|nr:lipoyl(octanoyl) transferase LipB [Bacteroidales bacterium]
MSYSVVYKDIGLMDYKEVWDFQATIFNKLIENKINPGLEGRMELPGTLIFVEHPHVYTLGKSGSEQNLLLNSLQLRQKDASYYRIDRGGDITYHGPGQIVGYPIFDLEKIKVSLKDYIHGLEEAVIRTVAEYGIAATRLQGSTGVWLDVEIPGKTKKICAIGVKASRYVTMHGFAFNVNTDLNYFRNINPCGITDKGVTSLEKELGERRDMEEVKMKVKHNLQNVFGLQWVNE